MPTRSVLVLILIALTSLVTSARAAPPRGPAFGNNRFRTSIGPASADTDDYVAPLVRGETLSVSVGADRRSDLHPRVVVLDPDGVDRTPATTNRRRGAETAFRSLEIDRTGPWTVRVASRDETSGAYAARFAVRPAPDAVARKQRLGPGALEREHVVDAVDGSKLSVSLRLTQGATADVAVTLAGPGGEPISLGAPRRVGRLLTWSDVPLAAGHGAYRVAIGIAEGVATYEVRLRAVPPPRPRADVVLSPLEPRLALHGVPEKIAANEPYELRGTNFSTGFLPRVWFGDVPATVFSVLGAGGRISVFPPLLAEGDVTDVTVENPDGQSTTARAYVVSVTPDRPSVAHLDPGVASVYTGGLIRYTLTLARPAPASGVTVSLAVDGGAGIVPAAVTVAAHAKAANFDFIASPSSATGRVRAVVSGGTRTADVAVVAVPTDGDGGGTGEPPPPPPLPDEIDISGWVVRQQGSSRDFTLPQGTRLTQGGYVVIGRAASRGAFEAYWGVTLATDVLYFNGDGNPAVNTDDWPSINGGETYELRDPFGTRIDGVTPAMSATAGENWKRTSGAPAAATASWTVTTTLTPGSSPTPGSGQPANGPKHGVYISEFSDTVSGASPYEFVELFYDGNP